MKRLLLIALVITGAHELFARPFPAISQKNAELISALVRDETKHEKVHHALARMAVTDSNDAVHASINALAQIDEAAAKVAAVYMVYYPPENVEYVTSLVGIATSELPVAFVWLLAHGQRIEDIMDSSVWNGDLERLERLCAEINSTLNTQGTFLEYARESRCKDASMFVCSPSDLRNWSVKQLRVSLRSHEWPADEKARLIHLHNTLMQTSFVPADGGETLPKDQAVALAAKFYAVPPEPQTLIKDGVGTQMRETISSVGSSWPRVFVALLLAAFLCGWIFMKRRDR